MKLQTNLFKVTLLILLLHSCSSNTTRLISINKSKNFKIKFYSAHLDREVYPFLFAEVDSGNSSSNYYFKNKKIYKLVRNEKSLIYTLVDKEPQINFSSGNNFSRLSRLDSLVFKKANIILDSIGSSIKRSDGATGFIIEVRGH